MDVLWPWLLMAGAGALHGLNPLNGWALAVAWGARPGCRPHQALGPLALGHAASALLVVAAVVGGLPMDRGLALGLAGGMGVLAACGHFWPRAPRALRAPAGRTGLALGSFVMATLQGAGLMLVPALVPLCLGSSAAQAPTGLAAVGLALAALAVHMGAMLAVTGLVAAAACRAAPMVLNSHQKRR
ncbi:MAG: hypothetical protein KIS62_17455 [Ramlibacter sp.]|nr:hypothetical protein [Ramlibacter sp.]